MPRTNPDRAYLRLFIQGEGRPLFGIGSGTQAPPSRVPVFVFCPGERQTPVCGVCLDLPRGRSGYPPALPVFLLPSFLNEGESRPLLKMCASVPPVGRSRLSTFLTRVPASEFLYEGEGRPLFQVGFVWEGPRVPVDPPNASLPRAYNYLAPFPFKPPNKPPLPSHPLREPPSCLSRERASLLLMCDTDCSAIASIHQPYPCPCFRVFI